MKEAFELCRQNRITITGVCSDNAANIKCALTKDHPLCLRGLIGDAVFWLSCSAHTSQLALDDFLTKNPQLSSAVRDMVSMVSWIGERDDTFKNYVPCKLPKYCCTRWNTLCDTLEAILQSAEEINRFLVEQSELEKAHYYKKIQRAHKPGKVIAPTPPPLDHVPEWWTELLDAVRVIKIFTANVEGDLMFQQDLYMAYRKAIDAFEALEENQFARALESYFIQRFVDTCNIEFAHLAYVFTAEGLSDFRERHPNFEDEQCLVEIGSLKACFRSLATNYYSNEEYNQLFLPGLFDLYLQEADFGTGENLYCWWKQRFVDKISSPGINHGRPVSLNPLAEIALIVVTMP